MLLSALSPNALVCHSLHNWAQDSHVHSAEVDRIMQNQRSIQTQNPVFNFLHSYYNVRGARGVRNLKRLTVPAQPNKPTLLPGATANDIRNGLLHNRGAIIKSHGILYDPAETYQTATAHNATSFLWNRNLLAATMGAKPLLNCFGLHEWAMLYWPEGASPPPSAAYQEKLPLRVDRQTINSVVERGGVSCTHFDALRFFAPAAMPYSRLGDLGKMQRKHQLQLEQPACVHAQMDTLRFALRLSPWLPSSTLTECLELAVAARMIDVSASPYDARAFGIAPIKVETERGKEEYREAQLALMRRSFPVRVSLLRAYDDFLSAAFSSDILSEAQTLLNL